MRKLILAAVAGGTLISGAAMVQTAAAQAYVVYPPARVVEPGYRYDAYGRPYYDDGYRAAPGYYAEGGAVLGSALADGYARVPYDRYGPDPNGMIAPDGHRIKCKLTDDHDYRAGRYMTRRVCD